MTLVPAVALERAALLGGAVYPCRPPLVETVVETPAAGSASFLPGVVAQAAPHAAAASAAIVVSAALATAVALAAQVAFAGAATCLAAHCSVSCAPPNDAGLFYLASTAAT